MTTQISSKTVTARKNHPCDYCGLPIQIGQKYDRSFNIGDEAYTWKSHVHCQSLVDKLIDFNNMDDEGVSSDDFYNHVAEEWSRIYGKPYLGVSYHKMLDEVLRHHVPSDSNGKGGGR